jgi:nicotinamide mononucleotide transporter
LQGIGIGVFLTALSYFVGIKFGWIESVNLLEAFAVFTSYVCTYLCVKERRINYPIGAVSTAAYVVLFVQSELIASALVNLYLTPLLVYGWFRWKKDSESRPVENVKLKMVPVYLLFATAMMGGAMWLTVAVGAPIVLTDSAILFGTILAQSLMDNKKLQNWPVWLVMNLFAIYTYAKAGLALVAFQYVFFFLNTVYGYLTWNRSKNNVAKVIDDQIAVQPAQLATA